MGVEYSILITSAWCQIIQSEPSEAFLKMIRDEGTWSSGCLNSFQMPLLNVKNLFRPPIHTTPSGVSQMEKFRLSPPKSSLSAWFVQVSAAKSNSFTAPVMV